MKVIVRIPLLWKRILMLYCFMSLLQYSFGQETKIVSGTVTDNADESIPGVNVLVKGTSLGTITDIDGSYSVNIPDGSNTLVFSFIGYQTQEVDIGNRTQVNVSLEPSLSDMEEVVVIGYGEQSRETLTTSVSKLDDKVLENLTFANPASALQGTIAGLRVQSTSGQPGERPRVVLRGGTSINNPNGSNPLYVIDGVIRNNMDHINSRDIESIQVLKDAAATSIYGSRASNGVIIVETKSGKAGVTQINYNYNLTSSDVGRLYDLADPKDFIYFMRKGIAASGVKAPNVLNFLTQANAGGTGNDLTNNTAFTTMYLTPENQYLLDLPGDEWGAVWETIPDPLDPTRELIFKGLDFQKTVFRRSYT
ncbi:MAG: carboxypeptidase-like regulatory domain-containing protein, partial [Anditalea sp.]